MSRIVKAWLAVLVTLGTLLVGAEAVSAQPSTSGTIKVWAVASVNSKNKPSPVVITGAFADYGRTQAVNSSGKPDSNGNYVKVSLKRGTFRVNIKQLNSAFSSMGVPSDYNSSNCSASYSAGPVAVPIVGGTGTGSYKGITGSINMTATVAVILPRSSNGSCGSNSNANPVAAWGEITGSGTVSIP